MARVNTRTDGASAWFENLPPVTKLYMCAIFMTTAAFTLGLVNPYHLALLWPQIIKKFEIWRLVTHFFFLGKFSLHWVMTMVFLHNYGVPLEMGTYMGRTADYVWIYLFGGLAFMAMSFLQYCGLLPQLVPPFSAETLCFMSMFIWSRNFPEQSVSIWGLVKLQAFYLPFGMMALIFLMGNDFMPAANGIFIGHLFHFFHSIYPRAGGANFLRTPQIVKNLVATSGIGTVNPAEVTAATGAQARAFTGRARRLVD